MRDEDPMAAVDLYCSFPFSSDLDFGQNSLRLAAFNILVAQKKFEDGRLKPLLISIGKGFGVCQIEHEVTCSAAQARRSSARRSTWASPA